MKHVDCTCSECRPRARAVAPTATITISLAQAPGVIADSIRHELAAHSLLLARDGFNVCTVLSGQELDERLSILANNITASLQGLHEEPALPAPMPVSARRKR